jgi:hypothetical protein
MLDDPAAGGELADLGTLEFSVRRIVDVLDARTRDAQLGLPYVTVRPNLVEVPGRA